MRQKAHSDASSEIEVQAQVEAETVAGDDALSETEPHFDLAPCWSTMTYAMATWIPRRWSNPRLLNASSATRNSERLTRSLRAGWKLILRFSAAFVTSCDRSNASPSSAL